MLHTLLYKVAWQGARNSVQVEDFYFSSAAGRARIVLGNRRWGENGYVASGRQQARLVQRTSSKACHLQKLVLTCLLAHKLCTIACEQAALCSELL